ncbi:MAG: hypothetical protein GKR96_04240 [Gammaproteobacteria bacterium]|nr:hypothetical protein [Gammaproteobacteria bacterium]
MANNCGDSANCLPCETPSVTANSYHVIEELRKWLSLVTCIPWYQSHPEGAEPDGQFGMVEVLYFERKQGSRGEITSVVDLTGCQSLVSHWEYDVSLTVKRTRKVLYGSDERTISAADVLMDVRDKYSIPKISKLITNLSVSKWNRIDSLVKDEGMCCWENEAQQNIELCVKRETSIRFGLINALCFQLCDNEITCPEKPEEC